jgi:hypothetical protein
LSSPINFGVVTPFHFVKLTPIVTRNGRMMTSKNITRPGNRKTP